MRDSSRRRNSEMMCLWERQARFSSSNCWPKVRVARILEYSLSTFGLHLSMLEQMRNFFCESAFRYEEVKILVTHGSSEWNEVSMRVLETVLMRQARNEYAFPTERLQSFYLQ